MKLSRRTLARTLAAGAAAATLPAQAPPPPASGDAAVAQARTALRNAAQIVRAVPLPMATEPATRFIPRN